MSRTRLRPDARWKALALTLSGVVAGGALLATLSELVAIGSPTESVQAAPGAPANPEVNERFQQGLMMLHAQQHEHALVAFHRVIELAPTMPEAHVNMGFALVGLKRFKEARNFFEGATALRPDQANAYYGLALSHEATGDLALATGAMRTYLHLARSERPEHLSRARAALWEWEQQRETPAASKP